MKQINLFDKEVPKTISHLLALTLWRPWDQAIVHGTRRIENRPWRRNSIIGQRIAIHAGKKYDLAGAQDMVAAGLFAPPPIEKSPEGIVGLARVAGFVTDSRSPWFSGPIGWKLDEVVALPEPVPCKGAQGLWRVPEDVACRVLEQVDVGPPTIYVTNFASLRGDKGQGKIYGPGNTWSIMRKPVPNRGHLGDGYIEAMMPAGEDFDAIQRGVISGAEYRDRCVVRFAGECHKYFPGVLYAVPGSVYSEVSSSPIVVQSGDTICCSCSRKVAGSGWCHRVWVADFLVKAGWNVIRDGVNLPAQPRPSDVTSET